MILFCFVETSGDSSIPSGLDTSLHSDYNKDDCMTLNYNINDSKIMNDDNRPMFMDSQVMSDSVCPPNIISCTNKSDEYSSTHQIESHQGIHNEEMIHKCSTCDKCFRQKGHLKQHDCIVYTY